jgi:hypothetical protein
VIILQSTVEVNIFGQWSLTGAIFLAAFVYARQSRKQYETEGRIHIRKNSYGEVKQKIAAISNQPFGRA